MLTTNDIHLINMQKSETARRELNRGIVLGVNPFLLLAIAVDCISDLTGDASFGMICSNSISDIYGAGLSNAAYIENRASELETSIEQLNESICNCTKADTRKRLEFALRMQKNELKSLKISTKRCENKRILRCF